MTAWCRDWILMHAYYLRARGNQIYDYSNWGNIFFDISIDKYNYISLGRICDYGNIVPIC